MRPIRLILASLLALVGCSTPPQRPAEVARDDYTKVRDYVAGLIRHEMARHDIVGLSIALVDDQRVVWTEGFGAADREAGRPATSGTLYRVGSLSKLFTDIAALQLAEQGRLDIDKPVRAVLPAFTLRPAAGEITPRLLMSHHAGLARDRVLGFMTAEPRPFAELAATVGPDDLAYPPGQVFSYSNLGISLLGAAVQEVAGRPFAEHLRDSLLRPLGMAQAAFETGPSASPLMAKGYRGLQAASEPALRDLPAGGLNASADDLARFMAMVFAEGQAGGRRLLRPETLAEMLRPQEAGQPLDLNFRSGLGWMLSSLGRSGLVGAGPVAHHSGSTLLFHSQLYILPAHKLGVAVLANSSTARQAIDRIATETLALALEARTGIRQPEFKRPAPATQPPAPEALRALAGDYASLAGLVRIEADGGRLSARIGGRTLAMTAREDGLFGLDYRLLGLFQVDLGNLSDLGFTVRRIAGRDLLVSRLGEQEMLVGERLPPPADPGVWRRRVGRYEIANLGRDQPFFEDIRLVEENGRLLFRARLTEPPKQELNLPLLPLSGREARLPDLLADGGEIVTAPGAEGELAISGYRLRRIGP